MSAIRLLPVRGTLASLAIDGPASATWDTVVEATPAYEGGAGNAITLTSTADGTGAGSFTVSGTAVTFHYETAVTLVSDFEAGLAADADAAALLRVKTAGTTQAYALLVGDDDFAATALTGGGATASAAPTLDDETAGVHMPFTADQVLLLVRNVDVATGTTKTVVGGKLWGFSPVTERWYFVGAVNDGLDIAETTTDAINYCELIIGARGFTRLYFQFTSLGGAGTEIEVYADCVPANSTTC